MGTVFQNEMKIITGCNKCHDIRLAAFLLFPHNPADYGASMYNRDVHTDFL